VSLLSSKEGIRVDFEQQKYPALSREGLGRVGKGLISGFVFSSVLVIDKPN